MNNVSANYAGDPVVAHAPHHHHHGLSWGAITGGVFLSMTVSLILVMLGSAIGLSSISPWSPSGATAGSFTVKVAVWFIIVQWVSSAVGAYLVGRVRCKWHGLHTDEVFFRDTANGVVTWAVATLIMTVLFASSVSSVISGGVKAASTVAAGASMGAAQAAGNASGESSDYYIDSLLRANTANTAGSPQDQRMEVSRIFAQAAKTGSVSENDKTYLAQIVASRSGISQEEAQKRVDDTIAQINAAKEKALQEAEEARKVALKVTLYLVISMFIGAFVAGAAAAFGGKQRDEY